MKRLFFLTILFIALPSVAHGATSIYRSVGPSATSSLDDGSASHTMTVSGTTATFNVALPDNVGVGDAIQYDDDGDSDIDTNDSIIFIHGRTSDRVYTVATASGGSPVAVTAEEQWNIFRAYTSLSLAETGTENTGIDADLVNFDTFTTGKDLDETTGSDEEWNIACYANGATADSTAVTIDGWTTDSDNFIRIYTPFEFDEVGESQRHEGVWNDNKYKMEITFSVASEEIIDVRDDYVYIEGLQIHVTATVTSCSGIRILGDGEINISENIIKGSLSGSGDADGIAGHSTSSGTHNIWNNVVYDFVNAAVSSRGIRTYTTATAYAYNNTVHNNYVGIARGGGTAVVKNNVSQDCTYGFHGSFNSASTHNITDDDAEDGAFGATADSGTTTSASSNKLIQTGQNFLTTVKKGMIAVDSASNYTYVTSVDSNTQLSVNDDYFGSSETFTIYTNRYGVATFADEGNDDFHLGSADTTAQNKGADLSSDTYIPFSTDIDGDTRVVEWDVGADQREPTEFISVVDPDDGSGTDYTTLALWETGVQSDLTTAATQVFSGAITTGSIADTDTLDLYRGGVDTGINANVTHATSTQLLVDTISNTSAGFEVGDVWRVDASNYFTISNTGDSTIAVAECRSTGGTNDTAYVDIIGWTTSATNYVKVWTDPDDAEEGRHNGVWDDDKYVLARTDMIRIQEDYAWIDGLQLDSGDGSSLGIYFDTDNGVGKASNNIIRNVGGSGAGDRGLYTAGVTDGIFYFWNNIIYGFDNSSNAYGIQGNDGQAVIYAYNNTLDDCYYGISEASSDTYAYNNIAQNCGAGTCFVSIEDGDYNISSDSSSTGGDNDQTTTTVSFLDDTNFDFHLDPADTDARDAGTDMSSDPNLSFTDDIDGDTRAGSWDVGADETLAATIFRSVGPSKTGVLDDDDSHADTIVVSSGTATFSAAIADNVGVGDAVLIDTGGTGQTIDSSDTILFIHGRTDSRHYTLKDEAGATPSDISSNDTWEIYRAYTSLALAETGTENTSIPISFTGGNRDIVANNEQWNIACYANGTTADNVDASINGWTTGLNNYIKIFTPIGPHEVGTSQRHNGKWDTSKYYRTESLSQREHFVRIVGLQSDAGYQIAYGSDISAESDSEIHLSDSIIKDEAISAHSTSRGNLYIYNNISYDFSGGTDAIYLYSKNAYVYNNTVYNSSYHGIRALAGDVIAINNLVVATADPADAFAGTFATGTDYNASDGTDTPGVGSNNITEATVNFVSTASGSEDLHLQASSTDIINQGMDLSSNPYLPFHFDIDLDARAYGSGWDIGADESTITNVRIKGGVRMKGGVKIEHTP